MGAGKIVLASGTTYKKVGTGIRRYRAKLSKSKLAYMAGKARKSKLVGLIKKVINKGEETKYVAEVRDTQNNFAVGQLQNTPANFKYLVPRVSEGTANHNRLGDRLNPVKAISTFSFYFTPENSNNQDVMVNLWIVTAKAAKNEPAVLTLDANEFLRVGDGTNRDPDSADQPFQLNVVNNMPLNTEAYTKLRHYKFCMRRGAGAQANQGPSTIVSPTGTLAREDQRVIKFSWKPPTLKYTKNGDLLPSNHCPIALIWATNRDGSAYGDVIKCYIRNELYFKDP